MVGRDNNCSLRDLLIIYYFSVACICNGPYRGPKFSSEPLGQAWWELSRSGLGLVAAGSLVG